MNRRSFFKTLVNGIIGLTITPKITPIFDEFINTKPVGEFEFYIYYQWQYHILNPKARGIIVNIIEDV